jgi:hypothetical protein
MQAILIETIPHEKQRYPTVGDYFTEGSPGDKQLRVIHVSQMDNPDYEFLVALHELVESYLVQKRGIPDQAIDRFDISFEARRSAGLVPKHAEPGDDPSAPYYQEHGFATLIERMMARELDVDWDGYARTVESL